MNCQLWQPLLKDSLLLQENWKRYSVSWYLNEKIGKFYLFTNGNDFVNVSETSGFGHQTSDKNISLVPNKFQVQLGGTHIIWVIDKKKISLSDDIFFLLFIRKQKMQKFSENKYWTRVLTLFWEILTNKMLPIFIFKLFFTFFPLIKRIFLLHTRNHF